MKELIQENEIKEMTYWRLDPFFLSGGAFPRNPGWFVALVQNNKSETRGQNSVKSRNTVRGQDASKELDPRNGYFLRVSGHRQQKKHAEDCRGSEA